MLCAREFARVSTDHLVLKSSIKDVRTSRTWEPHSHGVLFPLVKAFPQDLFLLGHRGGVGGLTSSAWMAAGHHHSPVRAVLADPRPLQLAKLSSHVGHGTAIAFHFYFRVGSLSTILWGWQRAEPHRHPAAGLKGRLSEQNWLHILWVQPGLDVEFVLSDCWMNEWEASMRLGFCSLGTFFLFKRCSSYCFIPTLYNVVSMQRKLILSWLSESYASLGEKVLQGMIFLSMSSHGIFYVDISQ